MSIRPSARKKHLKSHRQDLYEGFLCRRLLKFVDAFTIWLKSDKNSGHYLKTYENVQFCSSFTTVTFITNIIIGTISPLSQILHDKSKRISVFGFSVLLIQRSC